MHLKEDDTKWRTKLPSKCTTNDSVPKSPIYRRARPSRQAFVENSPYFCDFACLLWSLACSECCWAVIANRSAALWACTGSEFRGGRRNHKNLSFARLCARIFVPKTPDCCPSFYKYEPVWRIGNTAMRLSGVIWYFVCVCVSKGLGVIIWHAQNIKPSTKTLGWEKQDITLGI